MCIASSCARDAPSILILRQEKNLGTFTARLLALGQLTWGGSRVKVGGASEPGRRPCVFAPGVEKRRAIEGEGGRREGESAHDREREKASERERENESEKARERERKRERKRARKREREREREERERARGREERERTREREERERARERERERKRAKARERGGAEKNIRPRITKAVFRKRISSQNSAKKQEPLRQCGDCCLLVTHLLQNVCAAQWFRKETRKRNKYKNKISPPQCSDQ